VPASDIAPAGQTASIILSLRLPAFNDDRKHRRGQSGRRIIAISNTTTARSARRTAPSANVEEVASVEQMTELAKQRLGDAFALSHDSFAGLLPKLPGARVLPGNFQQTGIAIAVPKGRPLALKIASELLEVAKTSGVVRHALDAAGFPEASVAS